MFFVIFPIDVLFLDKNRKVVDLKENFKPFTFYTPKAKAKYVIELPNGIIKKTNTRINDFYFFLVLNWKYWHWIANNAGNIGI